MTTQADRTQEAAGKALGIFSHGELIGDAMTKLPFVAALRAAFPDWRIVWIATESSALESAAAPLIPGAIDAFHCGAGWGESPADLAKPPPTAERFALVIDTQNLWWRSLLVRRLKADRFVSSIAGYRFSSGKPAAERRNPRHVVDRLFSLLEAAAGAPRPRPRLRDCVRVPEAAAAEAARLLPPGPTYVALAPGAGKRIKCWPLDRFIEVARRQQALGRAPVFLLGPGEAEWLTDLAQAVPGALFPLQAGELENGGPRYTPVRTVAVARRCAAALSGDCGLGNMIAAADIPLVSLFGPTSGAKLHPKVTAGVWLQAQDFGGDGGMAAIPVDAAAQAVEKLLQEAKPI